MNITAEQLPASFLSYLLKKHKISSETLADEMEVSKSTVDSYRQGIRKPTEPQITSMVKALEKQGVQMEECALLEATFRLNKEVTFLRKQTDLAGTANNEGLSPEALDNEIGSATIRFDEAIYNPFSGKPGRFGDVFEARFSTLRLGGVEKVQPEGSSIEDRKTGLLSGKVDVLTNICCTMPRLRDMSFLLMPFRNSINVLHATSTELPLRSLAEALTDSEEKRRQLPPLRYLVLEGEVGHEFIQQHLMRKKPFIQADDVEIIRGSTPENIRELLTITHTRNDGTPSASVLIADEVICLELLRETGGALSLLFPLCTGNNVRFFHQRRKLPEFRIGFAVRQSNTRLYEYLRNSWRFLINSDTEFFAASYRDLYLNMVAFVYQAIEKQTPAALKLHIVYGGQDEHISLLKLLLAHDFARYSLRVYSDALSSYQDKVLPWARVIKRGYQLTCSSASVDRAFIKDCVSLAMHSIVPERTDEALTHQIHRIMKLVSRYLNVQIPETFCNTLMEYVNIDSNSGQRPTLKNRLCLDTEQLVTQLQQLLGEVSGSSWNETRIEELRSLQSIEYFANSISDLAVTYNIEIQQQCDRINAEAIGKARESEDPAYQAPAIDEAARLRVEKLEIGELINEFKQGSTRIFLAYFHSAFVGIVRLSISAPPVTLPEWRDSIRLQTLYVKPEYRRLSLATLLISKCLSKIRDGSNTQMLGRSRVVVDLKHRPNLQAFFERTGFSKCQGDYWSYKLLRPLEGVPARIEAEASLIEMQ